MSNFGIIAFFLLIVNVVSIFTDLGYRLLIVRELSVDRSLLNEEYLVNKIFLKALILIIVCFCVMLYGFLNQFWDYSPWLVFSLVISGLFLNLSNTIFTIFQAFNRFKLESVCLFFMVFLLSIVLILSRNKSGIPIFLWGYMISTILTFLFSLYILNKKIYRFRLSSFRKTSFASVKKEFIYIFPFASIMIIESLANSYDTFFVESYCSKIDLGIYSAILKIKAGLTILAYILINATMPILSRLTEGGEIKSFKKLSYLFIFINSLGALVFLFYYVFNIHFIKILLGDKYFALLDYDYALMILTITTYLRIVPGMFFITSNRQYVRLGFSIISLCIGFSYFYFSLQGGTVKEAIGILVNVKLIMTIIVLSFFSFVILKEYRLNKAVI